MSSYTITNSALNPKRVFILQKSEVEKRLDPKFYSKEYKDNLDKIKRNNYKRLGDVVKFSSETWNQKDFFEGTFPYIEISEIDTLSGEIQNITQVEKSEAASRAKMIVRENDIIISTTRPNRGAIALIKKEQDFSIASTGFSVIRNIINSKIDRNYLFAVLRQQIILKQFEQRSSGGNYPAITQEELSNVIIPFANAEKQQKVIETFENCFSQKQTNEAEAEKLLASIDDYLLGELGITLPTPPENTLKNRMFIANSKDILGGRFDPQFHIKKVILNNPIKLSKLVEIKGGKRIPKGQYYSTEPTDYQYLRVSNMKDYGMIDWNNLEFISKDIYQFLEHYKVVKGDIIISIAGTVGKTALIDKDIKNIILTENCAKLEIRDKAKLLPEYLTILLELSISKRQMELGFIQTTIPKLGFDKIEQILLPTIPPLAKQKEIAEHITGIRNQAQALKDKTNDLLKKASEEIDEILLG